MKHFTSLILIASAASVSLASPERLARRVQARQGNPRMAVETPTATTNDEGPLMPVGETAVTTFPSSGATDQPPLMPVGTTATTIFPTGGETEHGPEPTPTGNGQKQISYSSNWAGGVISSAANTWKSVTATFTVPRPTIPSGGNSKTSYSASAWVGIDGSSCGSAILQTGMDFTVSGSSVSYDAWYEWYPAYAYDFSGLSFSPGDTVQITVTANTNKTGVATVSNLTKRRSASKQISSSTPLCEKDVEWIVEDYQVGSSLVPFANFGTINFSGARATNNAGASVTPAGAGIVEISQGGKVLTNVGVSSSGVTVTHT